MTDSMTGSVPPVSYIQPPPLLPPATDITTTGRDLSRLVWRGLLLTLVTLGLYRFWYKTDLRRWYWRNTILNGTALEYRGNAKELFIGFLFALAVVLPIYFAGAIIGLFGSEKLGGIVQAASAFVIAFLIQYGSYRSRRYRLTRTVWRGLRLNQTGSAWTYAFMSAGYLIGVLLTLGIAFPVMRRALEAYKIRNTRFGSAEGAFSAPLGPLMLRWLLVLSPFLLVVLFALQQLMQGSLKNVDIAEFAKLFAALPFAFFLMFLLWPIYRVGELRTFINGTSIGPVSFVSKLPTDEIYVMYLKFTGLLLLSTLALGIMIGLVGTAMGAWNFKAFNPNSLPIAFIAMTMIGYLSGFIIFAGLKELYVSQPLWRLTIDNLGIINLEAANEMISQSVSDEAATGEGFGDALEFGGI